MNLADSSTRDYPRPPSDPPSGVRRCGVSAAFSGDAFSTFVAHQYKRADDWARLLNVSKDDAEDITQEALLCLWQNREAIERSGWPGWLCTAMVLRGRMHFRSLRRAQKHEVAVALHLQQVAISASPEVEIHLRQCERELLRVIDLLRPERRDVVRLYLLDELPMAEVATRLGIPLETAQKRWRLARASMRAAFDRDRAKERFKIVAAALAAFFVAFWARLFVPRDAQAATLGDTTGETRGTRGAPREGQKSAARRVHPRAWTCSEGRRSPGRVLAAVAGLAVLGLSLVAHAPPGLLDLSSSLNEAIASTEPLRPSLGVFSSGSAEREREQLGAIRAPVTALRAKLPRVLLAQASAALRDGRIPAARGYLAAYVYAYPIDPKGPFAAQYAALMAELATH